LETVTWGTGTAGPLTARFYALRVRPPTGRGDRWLLCERSDTDVRKYYLLHLPAATALVDLVALARSRWPIEQQYRELKDDLGLDHFEGRTYAGWTHHVVLAAVAFTFLQIDRSRARQRDAPRPTQPGVRGARARRRPARTARRALRPAREWCGRPRRARRRAPDAGRRSAWTAGCSSVMPVSTSTPASGWSMTCT
jgi:hypothetical protein